MRGLLNGHYIVYKKSLLITGPTRYGKNWIANALGEQACRQRHSVQYWRTGRLLEMLAQGRVDGSRLKHLQKTQVLILDGLGLEPLTNAQCNDLLGIIEDRYAQSSTIVVSQFLVDKWHGLMEYPTTADAILDRLVHFSVHCLMRVRSTLYPPLPHDHGVSCCHSDAEHQCPPEVVVRTGFHGPVRDVTRYLTGGHFRLLPDGFWCQNRREIYRDVFLSPGGTFQRPDIIAIQSCGRPVNKAVRIKW